MKATSTIDAAVVDDATVNDLLSMSNELLSDICHKVLRRDTLRYASIASGSTPRSELTRAPSMAAALSSTPSQDQTGAPAQPDTVTDDTLLAATNPDPDDEEEYEFRVTDESDAEGEWGDLEEGKRDDNESLKAVPSGIRPLPVSLQSELGTLTRQRNADEMGTFQACRTAHCQGDIVWPDRRSQQSQWNGLMRQVSDGLFHMAARVGGGDLPIQVMTDRVRVIIAPDGAVLIQMPIGDKRPSAARFSLNCRQGAARLLIAPCMSRTPDRRQWPTTTELATWRTSPSSRTFVKVDLTAFATCKSLLVTVVNVSAEVTCLSMLRAQMLHNDDDGLRGVLGAPQTLKRHLHDRIEEIKADPQRWTEFLTRLAKIRRERIQRNKGLQEMPFTSAQRRETIQKTWMAMLATAMSAEAFIDCGRRHLRHRVLSFDSSSACSDELHTPRLRLLSFSRRLRNGADADDTTKYIRRISRSSISVDLGKLRIDNDDNDALPNRASLPPIPPKSARAFHRRRHTKVFNAMTVHEFIRNGRQWAIAPGSSRARLQTSRELDAQMEIQRQQAMAAFDVGHRARVDEYNRHKQLVQLLVTGQQEFARLRSRPWSPVALNDRSQ
ncbi:N-acetyltransferase domain-containing protein [Plasmodiophora brassicae]